MWDKSAQVSPHTLQLWEDADVSYLTYFKAFLVTFLIKSSYQPVYTFPRLRETQRWA